MIVKMNFVSITGPTDDIDRVINTYLSKYEIHLENAMLEHSAVKDLRPYVETNPYKDMYARASELRGHFKANEPVSNIERLNVDTSNHIVKKTLDKISGLSSQIEGLNQKRKHYSDSYDKIKPFFELKYDMSSILEFKRIKFRFGRIPKEYWAKMEDYGYNDLATLFVKCTTDNDYVWGVYFVPESESDKVDAIYTSLHFERTYIPDESKGTPVEACDYLLGQIKKIDEKIELLNSKINDCLEHEKENILVAYERIKNAYENFDVRKVAACTKNDGTVFYIICGWMSETDAAAFSKELEQDDNVVCIVDDVPADSKKMPPTKLKNPKLFKPFEMYIRMYGLPAYNEIDPTLIVALTYSFIFGVMFGDVGQGFLLFLCGLIIYKVKNLQLAAIVSCAGVFSTFFGFMFGSIFGFEDIIEPVWLRPAAKMSTIPFIGKLNTIFIVAIAFGMGVIIFTMILNIINALRAHDIERAFFDTNGVAGLVFYGAVVATIVLFMTGNKLPAGIVLAVMFIIPLILIALKEPIVNAIEKKSKLLPDTVGMFIMQTFFEMFEVLLSYFSNTLSFVRVGAFAVSHAAMMEVVLMLAGAEAGNPNYLVVVLGNLFVMGLEGLIVGIQVLRLEYYEMFSRYYKGNGREFVPFKHK